MTIAFAAVSVVANERMNAGFVQPFSNLSAFVTHRQVAVGSAGKDDDCRPRLVFFCWRKPLNRGLIIFAVAQRFWCGPIPQANRIGLIGVYVR